MIQTILDSGPLVAFYDRGDSWHAWAQKQLDALAPPLLTCEPVLTEACFLLNRGGGNPTVVLKAVQEGTLRLALEVGKEARALQVLMQRYADVPMSLADACMVCLCERFQDPRVFTLDRDFRHYRRHGRQLIPLISPW